MKQKTLFTLLIIFIWGACFAQPLKAAADPPDLLIAEINPGTSVQAGREFVELYNPGTLPVDLANFKLQKHAASGSLDSGWQDYAVFPLQSDELVVQPQARLLVATKDYPDAQWPVKNASGALATAGGYLRLVRQGTTTEELDRMQWSENLSQKCEEGDILETAASFKRRQLQQGEFSTTGTEEDFCRSVQETPGQDDQKLTPKPAEDEEEAEEEPENPGQGGGPDDGEEPEEPQKSYLPVVITEILPDPASPLTDAADEFIELYNPHENTVDLRGYILEGGKDFGDRYVIKNGSIPAHGYLVFRSAQTDIGLSNSGGTVRLLDPNEEVVSLTGTYPVAKPGHSWVSSGGTWQWSATPTPGGANIVEAAPVKPAAIKKASTKKAAAPKAVKASAPKATSTKSPKNETKGSPVTEPAAITPDKPNYGILLAVVAAVAAYALFEYRHDIRNKFRQLKDNLGNRFGNRSGT